MRSRPQHYSHDARVSDANCVSFSQQLSDQDGFVLRTFWSAYNMILILAIITLPVVTARPNHLTPVALLDVICFRAHSIQMES